MLWAWEGAYLTAKDVIFSAKLSAFEHLRLDKLLVYSRYPAIAGEYILQRISENPHCSVEETLRSILEDVQKLACKSKVFVLSFFVH